MPERIAIESFPNNDGVDLLSGGMGVAVSNSNLAEAVARAGQTGIVSGTAIGVVLARRLQNGDPEICDALDHYPVPEIADGIKTKFFRKGGRAGRPYKAVSVFDYEPKQIAADLAVVGAFVEVWLAKKLAQGNGHIGMNLLTKIQEPTLHTLYGAMQAGVEIITMGAGLPHKIPEYMRQLATGRPVTMPIDVVNALHRECTIGFDPSRYGGEDKNDITIPRMLAIITKDVLVRRPFSLASVPPDGYIVENPVAGGHNAQPRIKGAKGLDSLGQPIYTDLDYADLEKMRKYGFPFWLAGGYGSPEDYKLAKEAGARGIQAGSVFALSKESGMSEVLKNRMLAIIMSNQDINVFTDPCASPTKFPFKIAQLEGTLSDEDVYKSRERVCDVGFLRELVEIDGELIYRCSSEPVGKYISKGGDEQDTKGRKCLCNGLLSTVGLEQSRPEGAEPPIITIGDHVSRMVRGVGMPLTAERIVKYILADQSDKTP